MVTPVTRKVKDLTNVGNLQVGDVVVGERTTGTTVLFNVAATGVSDGDKGDITVSSSGAVWTIDTPTVATVAANDKILIKDTSASDATKYVTAQSIADLAPVGYTDEQAQDAVGGMVDASLTYVDGTPLLQRAALTGDVTASAGSNSTTIANDAVTYAKIQNVSATDKLLGRSTSGAGDVEEIACTAAGRALIDDVDAAAQRTTLGLGTLATQSGTFSGTSSGTNTGDQTSIVGITGTKAEFDTAVTDGNFLYVGDVTQYTDELAQDAVGAMVDTTIVYTDGTPLLSRAALTGDVTANAGSNATTVALPSSATVATDDKVYIFDTSASDAKKYVTTQSIADLSLTFKTIAVSGQSDVVADSGTDTLTLAAGSNVTITTNASTDTVTIAASGGTIPIIPPTGRLTLASATPVMVSDQAAKTTIYYALYNGNTVPIYDGSTWTNTTYTELSAATSDTTKSPAAIGASKVNDWFVWNDSGTMRISHGPDWTNDTTRSAGTALTLVNGIYLNNASITNGPAASRGTYVGTTRSNASSQLDWILGGDANDGSPASLFVWNMYNRVSVGHMIRDTRASHTWTTASFQGINNATGMRVTLVNGLDENPVTVSFLMVATSTSNAIPLASGIGVDSTTVNSGSTGYTYFNSTATNIIGGSCSYAGNVGLGVHYVAALEYGGTNATQYGTSAPAQNGMNYLVRM